MSSNRLETEPRNPNPETLPFLLEVGCEEIPARFLSQAQKDLGERLHSTLHGASLLIQSEESTSVQTFWTPRRLVATVAAIPDRQPDKTEEVLGPPVKVAFDAAGKPTRAAESFAQKNAAEVKDLIRVTTPKGEYLALKKATPGRPALEVLSEILPGVITGISFPKSMYWEASKTRFVRPIRWIVALLGEGKSARVIPFEVAGVKSGDVTYGHRLAGNSGIAVSGFRDYSEKLCTAYVEFDPENRRQTVRTELNMLLEDSLEAVPDVDLVEWIVNSTEWLSGIRGGFDKRFLHLPREILITVMRDHQKYFAVQDRHGKLQAHFVAMLGRDRDATGTIRAGHERVLTARFSDAEFFWNADQKIPLRDRVPMLDRVTYQAKLGSYGDKVRRMEAIAKQICAALAGRSKITPADAAHVLRAVQLCKCDLTTQMVQEFTELQGIVGGLYARAQGEPQAVADAIYDHYKPLTVSLEDEPPRSVVGAVVSVADKLDAVVAAFHARLDPTGSSDPFGIRRTGNGIVKIAVEVLPRLDLLDLLKNVVTMELGLPEIADPLGSVAKFLRERTEYYLSEVSQLRYDTVRAVIRSYRGWSMPSDALARGKALEKVRDTEDYLALAIAAKRTSNILDKSAKPEDWGPEMQVNESLLTAGPERDLYDNYRASRVTLKELEGQCAFEEAFLALAKLRPAVDLFFDKVLVMDNDPMIRANRLRLLGELRTMVFARLADLSQVEGAPLTSVDA